MTKPEPIQPIPVKKLVFRRLGGVDLPGGHGLSSIKSGGQANRARYEIMFEPRIRHHRVTFHPPGNEPVSVAMIPEDWCWWEPDGPTT